MLIIPFILVALSCSVQAQNTTAAKAYTKQDGFYRVAVSNLADIFSLSQTEAETTSFYVENMGREVASIRDDGDVVFYAHRYEGPYTDENVFWIKPGEPSVVPTLNVGQGYTPYQPSFPVTKRFEKHNILRADLVLDLEEDPVLWQMFTSGLFTKIYTTTINVDAVVPGSAGVLRVRLKGATNLGGRYYHRARIDLNGSTLGVIDFEGYESKEASFIIGSGQWLSGSNTVTIESTPPAGTYYDSFYLDNIHAEYDRVFVADNNRLTFPVDSGSIDVSGFALNAIRVWDVTDQWGIRRVSGYQVAADGSLWKLTFDTTENMTLATVASGFELQPLKILPANDIGLKNLDWELDHLVISAPLLLDSAMGITSYRSNQGLDADSVTVNDIYDAFNYGIRDARAIARFLAFAYRNWAKHPRYVVLAGDGSLDNCNVLGFNDSLIPAVRRIGQNGIYLSDYLLGNIGETGQVRLAVGRIPVSDTQTLNDYIEKMIHYESGGIWRANKLVTTDQNDYGGDFLGIGNELSVLMDGNIFRGDLTTQNISVVRGAVIDGMNEGRELSMYVGHGTPNQLSSQEILMLNDMVALTNTLSPTAFVAIGCQVGSFYNPGKVNLGEGLITAMGGAAALIAAATFITADDGMILSEALLDDLYESNVARIGDAWMTGKNELTSTYRDSAFEAFHLLGDPALAIGSPDSPRIGNGAPSLPEYDEWAKTVTPPVLEDMGVTLLANEDEDGDNSDNFTEFRAGTDPFNEYSFLEVVKINRPYPGYVEVTWPSNGGRTYTLESSSDAIGPYTVLLSGIIATYPQNSETFPENTSTPHCYRVVVE